LKNFLFILIILLVFSCESIGLQQKNVVIEKPIATVFDKDLFKKDIELLLPNNVGKEDSILLIRNIINSWAIKELLLKKAEQNNSQNENSQINTLVSEYRQALLINGYKERVVKQQLDTVVAIEDIENYYLSNRKNFKLNEELIKVRYLHFSNDLIDKKEVSKFFKKGSLKDLEELELRQLSFKSMMLNDSVWTPVENVLLKTPFSRENLLKKYKFIQKEDSLGLYLVKVIDVLLRNDIAPLNYVKSTIKQIILHQRKLELIRDIEKIIVNDAIQNKNFKIH